MSNFGQHTQYLIDISNTKKVIVKVHIWENEKNIRFEKSEDIDIDTYNKLGEKYIDMLVDSLFEEVRCMIEGSPIKNIYEIEKKKDEK
jgi:hypothetical protein